MQFAIKGVISMQLDDVDIESAQYSFGRDGLRKAIERAARVEAERIIGEPLTFVGMEHTGERNAIVRFRISGRKINRIKD